jgi:pyruvate dehydrogenase kinase 2/3/4
MAPQLEKEAAEASVSPLEPPKELLRDAQRAHTPVSLQQIMAFGNATDDVLLASAKYLYREAPIRIANCVRDVSAMPFGLSHNPHILAIRNLYIRSYVQLKEFPEPTTREQELELTDFFRKLLRRNRRFVHFMSSALRSLRKLELEMAERVLLQEFIDTLITERLGLRLLLAHHVAMHDSKPGFLGVIQIKCSPKELVEAAAEHAIELCRAHHGVAPRVIIEDPGNATFRYVPTHLQYMAFELLKNAFHGVVKRHNPDDTITDEDKLPPVKVVIAKGVDDVCIKISDEGGGIHREAIQQIFSHMYESKSAQTPSPLPTSSKNSQVTVKELEDAEDESESSKFNHAEHHHYSEPVLSIPLTGVGYGLPVVRTYARYFGGDLELFSLPGYGTDVFLFLKRLDKSSDRILQ